MMGFIWFSLHIFCFSWCFFKTLPALPPTDWNELSEMKSLPQVRRQAYFGDMAHSKSNQTLIVPVHEHVTTKKGEVQISAAATMIMFSLIFSHKTICLIKTTGLQSAFPKIFFFPLVVLVCVNCRLRVFSATRPAVLFNLRLCAASHLAVCNLLNLLCSDQRAVSFLQPRLWPSRGIISQLEIILYPWVGFSTGGTQRWGLRDTDFHLVLHSPLPPSILPAFSPCEAVRAGCGYVLKGTSLIMHIKGSLKKQPTDCTALYIQYSV